MSLEKECLLLTLPGLSAERGTMMRPMTMLVWSWFLIPMQIKMARVPIWKCRRKG